MVGKVFSYIEFCHESEMINDKLKKQCGIYMTVNWLIVSTLTSLVISLITLFPFSVMNKKNKF